MKEAKYKVGIIGCGMIFDRHIEAIKANTDSFELVALCDIDDKKTDIRSKEYCVPGFKDYKKMLNDMSEKMNFVVIATPNSLHYQQAIDSLNSGYDVLIEKPIAFSHKKIEEISKLANKLNKKTDFVLQGIG